MSIAIGSSWSSYGKIYALGHKALQSLFNEECTVEEKLDGSQFQFGVYGSDRELRWRSKDVEMNRNDMFTKAIAVIQAKQHLFQLGWKYCGEYLGSPAHNTQSHSRIPKDHIAIFDVCPSQEAYLPYEEKRLEAARLGFETVPLLYHGKPSEAQIHEFMSRESFLGGCKIEGVVIKNYSRFDTTSGKVLMGKYVSEAFKEVHRGDWKVKNPQQGDVLHAIITTYRVDARWQKAVQHLREKGLLTDSPKDIGPLMIEIQNDILAECRDEILSALFKWAWPKIKRDVCHGAAEWYKEQLLKLQFSQESEAS